MTERALSNPITLRLPADVLTDIETIAALSDRTRTWVMVRALRHYLTGEGAQILAAARGLTQLREGEAENLDDVIREVEHIVRGDAA